jgi:hypothetical protein
MTEQEVKDEKIFVQAEYNALKKHLGELLLEHNAQEENPDDVAYFTRKFEETRKKLRK